LAFASAGRNAAARHDAGRLKQSQTRSQGAVDVVKNFSKKSG